MVYATPTFEPPDEQNCPYCGDPDCPATERNDCPDYEYDKSVREGEYEDENPQDYFED
jgi:hypothetical protein